MPEAGLKEIQAKTSASGGDTGSAVDTITALLEKTLTDLRVSFSVARAQFYTVLEGNINDKMLQLYTR